MAARYWVNGGTGLWNSTTNWSTTSGGASGASVPTSADDVTFDGNGNSNSTISATITVLSLTITSGYTSTITHNQVLTINGNITFGANYTVSGTSGIVSAVTCTITSNGFTWPNNITLVANNTTRTLVGDFTVGGTLIVNTGGGGGSFAAINRTTTEKIFLNGLTLSTRRLQGNAEIVLKGGTWSAGSSADIVDNNLTINGSVTIGTNAVLRTGTLTYDSTGGPYIVTTTGSTLILILSLSINTDGIIWNNIAIVSTSATTITMLSDVRLSGTSQLQGNAAIILAGSYTWHTGGISGSTNPNISGSVISFTYNGTWSGTTIMNNNLIFVENTTIATSSGIHNTGTITGSTGTVTGTLQIQGTAHTIDTAGVTWDSITFGAFTYTINSTLTGTGTFSTEASTTFTGTHGWVCGTLSHTGVSAFTVTLQEGITYEITTLLSVFSSRIGSAVLFTSSSGVNRANLILRRGAECRCLCNFTRIDASGGRPIRTFNGVVTDSPNVVSFFDLKPVSSNY
jgi:hypothetical protein